jgi:hypothetical protein
MRRFINTGLSNHLSKAATLGSLGVIALCAAQAHADIVTPNALAGTEGNSAGNIAPGSGVGWQFLFEIDPSQFSALGSNQITGLAFRPAAGSICGGNPCGSFAATTLHNVSIELATSTIALGSDSTFADYLTTNTSTVLPSSTVTVSSSYTGPTAGPKAFDIVFNFSTPYTYHPSDGDLVVDLIINSTDGIPVFIDADQSSATHLVQAEYFGGAAATAGLGNSNVDVLDFLTTSPSTGPSVPEPSSFSLIGVGILGLVRTVRRCRT